MTIADRFFNERAGKYIDDDKSYGAQCMDLYADYQRNYLKVTVKGAPSAKLAWDSYNTSAFTKIVNTPSFVPKRGDVAVWNMGSYGHIAICTGEGNTNYFVSLDQNWDSPWDGSKPSRYVTHNYTSFLGVLRPKKDVNFDQEAWDVAVRAQQVKDEEARLAKLEADRLAKLEAERIAAEQKALAEEQARLEKEILEKEEADRLAEEARLEAETIKEETEMKEVLPRLKSPVVLTAVLAQILLILGLFMPQLSDTAKVVGMAIIELLTVLGVLNNPTDKENF